MVSLNMAIFCAVGKVARFVIANYPFGPGHRSVLKILVAFGPFAHQRPKELSYLIHSGRR